MAKTGERNENSYFTESSCASTWTISNFFEPHPLSLAQHPYTPRRSLVFPVSFSFHLDAPDLLFYIIILSPSNVL